MEWGLFYKPKFLEVIKNDTPIYNDNNYWIVPLNDAEGEQALFKNPDDMLKTGGPLLFEDVISNKRFFSQYAMHLLRKTGRQLDLSKIK